MRRILPGIVGNIFEWYEFSLYAYFATDISTQFFPHTAKSTALIETFAVFATGFITRPLGAMFFGHYGDKFGRKIMLNVCLILMAAATCIIGLIPTYNSIGMMSVIVLLICRMVQGFALGGEYSGSVVYLIELADPNRKGFFGAMALSGVYTGLILGSLVSAITVHLAKDNTYHEYAWRLPFLLGIFLAILGIYIRRHMPETKEFSQALQEQQLVGNPTLTILKTCPFRVLQGIAVNLMPAVASYIVLSYLPTHIVEHTRFQLDYALFINSLTMLLVLFVIAAVGYYSDKIGRKVFLLAGTILAFLGAYPLFVLTSSNSLWIIFCAQTTLLLLASLTESVIPATLSRLFPVHLRYTGVAISLNVSNGFFGGTAPLVAIYLVQNISLAAPGLYIMVMAIISLCAVLRIHA